MTPEISEFTYGFALTNQLVGWTTISAAPIFPSLVEEGKQGGGYDVMLDMPAAPLYLQFKCSECMTRRSAREIKSFGADLEVPYYRFPITERHRSFQHTSLVELDDGFNMVFYVAPRFHTLDDINSAWQEQTVAQRSILVSPRTIGLIDDDGAHSVAFDPFAAFFCSEARQLFATSIEELREKLLGRIELDNRPLRTQLAEWKQNAKNARARAEKTQVNLEISWEERRHAGRPDGFLPSYDVAPEGLRAPDMGRLPPPLPEMDVRPPRERTPEEADLQELSDLARRDFNAQLFVVQPKEG